MKNISKEESEVLGFKIVEKKSKIQENIESQEVTIGKILSLPAPPVDEKEENEFLRKKNAELKKKVQKLEEQLNKMKHKEEKRIKRKEKKMETD